MNCTLTGNHSDGHGGGIASVDDGIITVINSIVQGNTAALEDQKVRIKHPRRPTPPASLTPDEVTAENTFIASCKSVVKASSDLFGEQKNYKQLAHSLIPTYSGDTKLIASCIESVEPMFLSPPTAPTLDTAGEWTLDKLRVCRSSDAVDRGAASEEKDLVGVNRGDSVDIGAFEYPKRNEFLIEFVDHANRTLVDRIAKVNEANSDDKLENDVAEIWLDSGFHSIEKTIELPAHVAIRGGFSTTEKTDWLVEENGFFKLKPGVSKDISARRGDQTNPDDPNSPPESVLKGNRAQTVLHVNKKRGVLLDRLFVMGGYAKKTIQPTPAPGEPAPPALPAGDGSGGGLKITRGPGGFDCDVRLDQCAFAKNKADNPGGAIWTNGDVRINQCTIAGNESESANGGALAIAGLKEALYPAVIADRSLVACNIVAIPDPTPPATKPPIYLAPNSDVDGKISNSSSQSFFLTGHTYRDTPKIGGVEVPKEQLDAQQKIYVGMPTGHIIASRPKDLFLNLDRDKKPDLRPTRLSPLVDQLPNNECVEAGYDLFGEARLSKYLGKTGSVDIGAYEYQFEKFGKSKAFTSGTLDEIISQVVEANTSDNSEHVAEITLDGNRFLIQKGISLPPFVKISGRENQETDVWTDKNSLAPEQELAFAGITITNANGIEISHLNFFGSRAEIMPDSRSGNANPWEYSFEKPADDKWKTDQEITPAWQKSKGGFGGEATDATTKWTTSKIWLRKKFELPNARKNIRLTVRHELEQVEIFVNGTSVDLGKGKNESGTVGENDYFVVMKDIELPETTPATPHIVAVHGISNASKNQEQYIDVGIVASRHTGINIRSNSLWTSSINFAECSFSGFNRAINASGEPNDKEGKRTKLVITSSRFENNRLDSSAKNENGAALKATNSELTISNSLFRNNKAESNGGGISAKNSIVHVSQCTFHDNSTLGNSSSGNAGGAIHLDAEITGKITSSTFAYNRASIGGAVWIQNKGIEFKNNLCTRSYSDGNVASLTTRNNIEDSKKFRVSEIGFGAGFMLKQKMTTDPEPKPTEIYLLPEEIQNNYLGEIRTPKFGKNSAVYFKIKEDDPNPIKPIEQIHILGHVSPSLSTQLAPIIPLWQKQSPIIDNNADPLKSALNGDFSGESKPDLGAGERKPVIPYVVVTVIDVNKEPVVGQELKLGTMTGVTNSKGQAVFRNAESTEIGISNGFTINGKGMPTEFGWEIQVNKN